MNHFLTGILRFFSIMFFSVVPVFCVFYMVNFMNQPLEHEAAAAAGAILLSFIGHAWRDLQLIKRENQSLRLRRFLEQQSQAYDAIVAKADYLETQYMKLDNIYHSQTPPKGVPSVTADGKRISTHKSGVFFLALDEDDNE